MWSHHASNKLPRTGQTASYRTGDDGDLQAGLPGRARFVNVGNGTIYDRATGLTWVRQPELIIPGAVGVHATNQVQAARGNWATGTAYAKADLAKDTVGGTYWVCAVAHTSAGSGTFSDDRAAHPTYWRQTVWTASAANLTTPATMDWEHAIDNSLGSALGGAGLSYAGLDDWRLPNVLELLSLVDWSQYNPAIPAVFAGCKGDRYWTSTAVQTAPAAQAFCANLTTGFNEGRLHTNAHYVRPVRGGRING